MLSSEPWIMQEFTRITYDEHVTSAT